MYIFEAHAAMNAIYVAGNDNAQALAGWMSMNPDPHLAKEA